MQTIKTRSGLDVLLPRNDYLFKLLFGDRRNELLLKTFLQAVLDLPGSAFSVTLLDTHTRPELDGKLCILDVRVQTGTGRQIDIEMQVLPSPALFERICYYKSLMITEQLSAGMEYYNLKKVISIVIADFSFIESGDPGRYHHCFRLVDKADGSLFGDVEEIHTLEIPRLPEQSDGSAVWDWTKFIGVRNEEELEMLAAKNEALKGAVSELYRLSAKDDVRLEYEAREKALKDYNTYINGARLEGREEGIKVGRKEGREEGRGEGRQEMADEVLRLLDSGGGVEDLKRMLTEYR